MQFCYHRWLSSQSKTTVNRIPNQQCEQIAVIYSLFYFPDVAMLGLTVLH